MSYKKTFIAIFIAITVINNSNFCMEAQDKGFKQLLIIQTNDNYKKLKIILKKNIIENYNGIHPALQYEMLQTCIDNNNMKSLSLCLKYNFNPNRYHKGLSLLHHAIERNNPEALLILSRFNPDLIPFNMAGQTPLDYAASLNYQQCIDVMAHVIGIKYNYLVINQCHCGLTKHILKPGPCWECMSSLYSQLLYHDLWEPCDNISDGILSTESLNNIKT
jgi:hypothetical protein